MASSGELRSEVGEVAIHGEGLRVVLEVRGRVDDAVITAIAAAADVALDARHAVTVDLTHVAGADPGAVAAMATFFGTRSGELHVTGGSTLFATIPP